MEIKTCGTCKTEKPLADFAKERRQADGHCPMCRECRKAVCRKYRHSDKGKAQRERMEATAEWRARHKISVKKYRASALAKEKQREWWSSDGYKNDRKARRRIAKYKEKHQAANLRYNRRHPDRQRARQAVNRLVRSGRWQRASDKVCEHCGRQAQEYHHHKGYAKEHRLDVIPLCEPCHKMADHPMKVA